eukprot:3994008-Heterocapsa_arctica.AAC.1
MGHRHGRPLVRKVRAKEPFAWPASLWFPVAIRKRLKKWIGASRFDSDVLPPALLPVRSLRHGRDSSK